MSPSESSAHGERLGPYFSGSALPIFSGPWMQRDGSGSETALQGCTKDLEGPRLCPQALPSLREALQRNQVRPRRGRAKDS